MTFKIIGADGREYGPIRAEVVREWVIQKRADATTLVQAEGSNEWKRLSAFPKILICPADSEHKQTPNWAEFDPAKHLTYEFLQPGIAESNAVEEIIFRCPIHDTVALGNGSVHMRPKRQIR